MFNVEHVWIAGWTVHLLLSLLVLTMMAFVSTKQGSSGIYAALRMQAIAALPFGYCFYIVLVANRHEAAMNTLYVVQLISGLVGAALLALSGYILTLDALPPPMHYIKRLLSLCVIVSILVLIVSFIKLDLLHTASVAVVIAYNTQYFFLIFATFGKKN